MSIFTKATPANSAKTPDVQKIIYIYIIILAVLLLCQLFTYDSFNKLIESFWLPGGLSVAHLIAYLVIIFELLSLPFLLRMNLSRLMRMICMISSWLVPLAWLLLTLWINLTVNAISNVGFLGAVVSLTPGWWAVCVSVAMAILATWSSWGLWPLAVKSKKR